MGHQGYEKTLSLIWSRFLWPGMSKDVESWVQHCGRCFRFKGKPDRAPLVGIQTLELLELVCTDFLKVDSAQNPTGFSPYFLMFGREPRLAVGNIFPLCSESRGDYITNVKKALEWAWAKASENGYKAKESQKNYDDKRVRGATLILGDKVLVRNCSFEGPHKLQDKWSDDIFVVKEQPDSRTPVLVVEPENGGRKRTLHRNLLLL
ncbi:hypothetical protein RRG08_039019 [Elysia crispata]|uniref:Integrase zinc-binding domain-containing protein n=1 Tax=Elysia crispata TaxID=231223 RepID=A0AAE1AUQ3_9GAST|nr:hypothetical protein RRG08_039019 [Elysia crispata]